MGWKNLKTIKILSSLTLFSAVCFQPLQAVLPLDDKVVAEAGLSVDGEPLDIKTIGPSLEVADAAPTRSFSPPRDIIGNKSDSVLIKRCTALVLVDSSNHMMTGDLSNMQGLVIKGLDVPGSVEDMEAKLDPLFLNKEITPDQVLQIKRAIALYYKDRGRPVVMVHVPEQDVTDGVLQLIVNEGRVGNVTIEGNKWYSSEKLREYIRLKPNEEIDEDFLMQDLNFLNRNPFRRLNVIYAPGESEGLTDVRFMATDRRPYRFYAGTENTGVEQTGRGRWFAGFNWANAWGLDHILSFQYTGSTDISRLNAYTAQYQIPLSWGHVIDFFGGYSNVRAKMPFPGMKNEGMSAQASGRYKMPLIPYLHWIDEVEVGADWKRTNNTIEFGGPISIVAQNANLFQFMTGYSGTYESRYLKISMDLQLYWSPGAWMSDQTDSDYDSLVPFSQVEYAYIKTSWAFLVRLPRDFSFSAIVRGQIASSNLLPTEQFGIGGAQTVRGYEERQLNKEQAFLASVELRTPAIKILERGTSRVHDALQFIVFLDYGWGNHHREIPGLPGAQHIAGTGPGIRYAIDDYLSARADMGIKLDREYPGGERMYHFGVTASY